MKNKDKTTTRIKLSETKKNNKNIFGILGFGKNKQHKQE